jgi:hypothetical protein
MNGKHQDFLTFYYIKSTKWRGMQLFYAVRSYGTWSQRFLSFFVFVINVGRKLSACCWAEKVYRYYECLQGLIPIFKLNFSYVLFSSDVRREKVKSSDTLITSDEIVVVTSLQIDDLRLIFNIFISQEQFIYIVDLVWKLYEEHPHSTILMN